LALVALLLIPGMACSARQTAVGERVDRNVITQAQIREGGFRNAYEAVEALKAPWLRIRPDGLNQQREVLAYLDDIRLGGIQTLKQVLSSEIVLIRYYDSQTAIMRWGVDHSQGVIMVVTLEKRSRRRL
jgi:hypothetical protein